MNIPPSATRHATRLRCKMDTAVQISITRGALARATINAYPDTARRTTFAATATPRRLTETENVARFAPLALETALAARHHVHPANASTTSSETPQSRAANHPPSTTAPPPATTPQLERLFVLQASRHRRQHHVLRRLHRPHVHLKRHVPGHEREPGLRGCAGRWRRRRSYCAVGWWRWRGSAEIRRQSCDQAVIHRDCRCRWTTYSRCYIMSRWRTRRKQLV